jgi:hypothetical protein
MWQFSNVYKQPERSSDFPLAGRSITSANQLFSDEKLVSPIPMFRIPENPVSKQLREYALSQRRADTRHESIRTTEQPSAYHENIDPAQQ